MHVVAQRRVLDREKYAFAGHDRRAAGGERLVRLFWTLRMLPDSRSGSLLPLGNSCALSASGRAAIQAA
jgi:hypothetical protein